MFKEELIYSLKSGSLKDLVQISLIKTNEDVTKYKKLGYSVDKLSNFKKKFPELMDKVDKFYYQKALFPQLIYYDKVNLVLIESNIYVYDSGFDCPIGIDRLVNLLQNIYNDSLRKRLYFVPEMYKLEFILDNLSHISHKDKYEYFMEIYTEIDFGFDKIDRSDILEVFNSKTQEQIKITKEKLKDLPEEIKVYRGIGSKSLKDGYSYSLSWDVARFFAFRLSTKANSVKILEGYVKKSDIIEYITDRNEEELLILPDKVYNKKIYNYHSFDKYSIDYEVYNNYRNLLVEYCSYYNLDFSNEHDVSHMCRVLVLSMLLCDRYNVDSKLKNLIYTAAIFHDIGRENDIIDTKHGYQSYLKLINYNDSFRNEDLCFLMSSHCIDDNKLKFKNKNQKLCLDILKDADALDRQRFGVKDLDSKYLRLPFSKKLSFYAFKLLNVKM